MRGPGLFAMLQYAAGLSMAGPIFYLGIAYVSTGDVLLGVFFFALGAVVTYAPTYVLARIGGPRTWIRRRLRRGGSEDETAAESTIAVGESDGSTEQSDDVTEEPTEAHGSDTVKRLRRIKKRIRRR
ncbi:hypothetical protein OB905_13780 [Halobacteria archaeon AArc-dxtr1]|nr:hypothetical protein [Halobacteria archaeon AArc-dxtr1]